MGRNYADHARELGNEMPERPLLFFKPSSSVIATGEAICLPAASNQVEFEAEIAVRIGRRAAGVTREEALEYVAGYAPLNDVTARDLQRSDGQWARAKGFDTFCPLGTFTEAQGLDPASLEVICRVNGVTRQHGRAAEMAFDVPELVSYISSIMTLEPGDVIATGTPAGVGPLAPGDVVEVEVPGVGVVSNPVVAR